MKFLPYNYEINDDRFEARISLFKYMIGLYTALIAASLIGFEKAKTINNFSYLPDVTIRHPIRTFRQAKIDYLS